MKKKDKRVLKERKIETGTLHLPSEMFRNLSRKKLKAKTNKEKNGVVERT